MFEQNSNLMYHLDKNKKKKIPAREKYKRKKNSQPIHIRVCPIESPHP